MRFLFCKAQTTLCVHSRKNRRGAIKQNRLNKQNGAGRLFTAPEPSAPSGRWGSQKKAHRITGALFLLQSANDPVRSQPQEPAGCNKAKPIEQAKRRGAAVHCAGAERAQWAMQRGGGGAGNRAMCCGQKPAVQRDNFRARNGRWFEPGRGSRVGQGCALFKTSGSGRNVSHTAPPALLFPAKSCGAAFRGGPFYCASDNRCAFSFAKRKRPCAFTAARTGGV